jgi:hypothetical protein
LLRVTATSDRHRILTMFCSSAWYSTRLDKALS